MELLRKLTNQTLPVPTLQDLPDPPRGRTGWPWTQECETLPERMPDGSHWPRVSIVTPSLNQGRFIEECIRSVLLQGYPNLEYIIIDGGSSDESVDIIKKYERWLTYWESEPDRGQSHAINKGLRRCTGQYFNWHNSDDVLTPNSLATAVSTMVTYPQASYVHGYRIIIDKQSVPGSNTKHSYGDNTGFFPQPAAIFDCLRAGCQPGCLMRKDYVQQAGMVDENLHYAMDADLLIRLSLIGPPVYVPAPLVYLRLYAQAKSCNWNEVRAKEKLILADKIFSQNELPEPVEKFREKALSAAHQHAWQCYFESRNFLKGFGHLLLDLRYASPARYRSKLDLLKRIFSSKPKG